GSVAVATFSLFALVLGGSFHAILWLAWPLVAFTLAVVGYHVVLLERLARTRPTPMNIYVVMACWIAVGVCAWPDFVSWLGYGKSLQGFHGACLGIMAY